MLYLSKLYALKRTGEIVTLYEGISTQPSGKEVADAVALYQDAMSGSESGVAVREAHSQIVLITDNMLKSHHDFPDYVALRAADAAVIAAEEAKKRAEKKAKAADPAAASAAELKAKATVITTLQSQLSEKDAEIARLQTEAEAAQKRLAELDAELVTTATPPAK
jgi:hypothetical protein